MQQQLSQDRQSPRPDPPVGQGVTNATTQHVQVLDVATQSSTLPWRAIACAQVSRPRTHAVGTDISSKHEAATEFELVLQHLHNEQAWLF